MAPEVFEALSDAGLFALWKPRAVGGYETEPIIALKVFEAVARIDASLGWAVANQDGIDTIAGTVLQAESALEMLADPKRPISGAWSPPGVAFATSGGYRVTGRWPFASLCHYAQSFTGMTMVHGDDGPRMWPDGSPVMMVVFTPDTGAKIVDNWNTMGMRGTGSSDVEMSDEFVPERHAWIVSPTDIDTDGPVSGPLYGLFPWMPIASLAPIGLGIAQGAIDHLGDLAKAKTPAYTMRNLRDRDLTQAAMGRAHALLSAARAYVHSSVEAVYEARLSGRKPSVAEGLEVQLATCNALEAGQKVTELVNTVVGTSGFREEHRFEQLFRDSHTIGHHAFGAPARYESVGQILLGLQTDWAFLQL
jgi:alkylation response protein AidB-like acyl-CoA dehydrogenase